MKPFLQIAKIAIFAILIAGLALTSFTIRIYLQNLIGHIEIETRGGIRLFFYSGFGITLLYAMGKWNMNETWGQGLTKRVSRSGSILEDKFFHESFYFLSDLIMDFWFLYRNRNMRFKLIVTGLIVIWWHFHLFSLFMLSMMALVSWYLMWDISGLVTAWIFKQEVTIQVDLEEYNSFFLSIPQCFNLITKIPHIYAFLILYTTLAGPKKTLSKDMFFRFCYYRFLGIPLSLIRFIFWNAKFCDLLTHRLNPTRKNPKKWYSILKYEFAKQFPIKLNTKFSLLITTVSAMRILTEGRRIWTNPNKYLEYETVLTGKMACDILLGKTINPNNVKTV